MTTNIIIRTANNNNNNINIGFNNNINNNDKSRSDRGNNNNNSNTVQVKYYLHTMKRWINKSRNNVPPTKFTVTLLTNNKKEPKFRPHTKILGVFTHIDTLKNITPKRYSLRISQARHRKMQ